MKSSYIVKKSSYIWLFVFYNPKYYEGKYEHLEKHAYKSSFAQVVSGL